MASDLTDNSDWHGVYNGGTTTGETTSTSVDFDAGATAGEYQVLRLELFPNGTVEWWLMEYWSRPSLVQFLLL